METNWITGVRTHAWLPRSSIQVESSASKWCYACGIEKPHAVYTVHNSFTTSNTSSATPAHRLAKCVLPVMSFSHVRHFLREPIEVIRRHFASHARMSTTRNAMTPKSSVYESGTVRGLLCGNCNQLMGRLEQDKERVKRMLEYIENDGF